jgi:ABC-type hemin transport system substrate-binding protein
VALFERLRVVPAVRDGRIITVSSDALYRTGPRVVDAVEILAAAIAQRPASR